MPRPHVVPGACTLLVPLHFPMKTDRKRRAAAPFAMEPHLAAPLESVVVAIGHCMGDDVWICAAIDTSELEEDPAGNGPVLPDTLAVPLPEHRDAWCLWFGERTAHLRLADGTGLSVSIEALPDLWRSQGRPAIELAHGEPPAGVEIARHLNSPSDPDPEVLKLDLRRRSKSKISRNLKRWLKFVAVVAFVTALAHTALLHVDAHALAKLAEERTGRMETHLVDKGVSLDLSLPTRLLTSELAGRSGSGDTVDPFMALLSQVGDALDGTTDTSFRELRFDADTRQITVLLTGPDLEALQRAETRLRGAGLKVVAGAARRVSGGAERQLVIGASE
ncbi:MAG: type II secretion system protein GspL [Pseudomonadota bacterium]